jgi:hypothetical protein
MFTITRIGILGYNIKNLAQDKFVSCTSLSPPKGSHTHSKFQQNARIAHTHSPLLLQIAKTQNLINVASNQTQRLTIIALNRKRKHSHCYKSQTQSFTTTIANRKRKTLQAQSFTITIPNCKHRTSLLLLQITKPLPHDCVAQNHTKTK